MNKQRKVLVTITYNEMGIIIDTKTEELDLSAEPEVKHGKWKARNFHILYCTNCAFEFDIMTCEFISDMKYCPNCGAKMEVQHE